MNKFTLTALFAIPFSFAVAQSLIPSQTVQSKIESAILYLDGAELTQRKTITLNPGRNLIIFSGITPKLVSKSVQVTSTGDVSLLSVSDRINYLTDAKETAKTKQLKDSLEMINDIISQLQYDREAYDTEKKMINANQRIGGNEKGVAIAELKLAADFYRSRIKEINGELFKLDKKIENNQKTATKLQLSLAEINGVDDEPTAEIEILVNNNGAAKAGSEMEIKYIVANAGWVPTYDLIAEDINKPIQLKYKAKVFNNTNVDWNDIKIKLSTGDPMKNASKPELMTWYLNYNNAYQQNMAYQQTYNSYSNTTSNNNNNDQNYNAPASMTLDNIYKEELKKKQLEVQQKKGQQVKTTIAYEDIQVSELSAEFEIKQTYSIPSDAKPYLVDVTEYNLPATYKHFCVPKMEKEAFMLARITGWEELNLVEGSANVYFGGTYVGQSYINPRSVDDTLDLSFGRDKKIIVTRTKLKDLNKDRVIGNNKKVTFSYEMVVKNNRKGPVTIELNDQLPVSKNTDIVVENIELSKAQLDPATGKLKWVLTLAPDEMKKVILTFSVKYPRDQSINMDNMRKKSRAKF
ncbi:MAG: hypothetical protein K0S33_932 [Bacteroidetes bacterium]|jgi:uncharacterized protein (TIGR02231 family)|nr:hypothetical protein [Bacteroidota bacterium]